MGKLQIIVGSTRPTRAAERVFPLILEQVQGRGRFDVEGDR